MARERDQTVHRQWQTKGSKKSERIESGKQSANESPKYLSTTHQNGTDLYYLRNGYLASISLQMPRAALLLVFISCTVLAQNSPFKKLTLSLGYGYFDFEREIDKRNIHQHSLVKNGQVQINNKLIGPLYLKVETPISPKIRLALCFAFENYSFLLNEEAYVYSNQGSKDIVLGDPNSYGMHPDSTTYAGVLREQIQQHSWSLLLRTNFILFERDRFQMYLGLGLGYRYYQKDHDTNIDQLLQLSKKVYFLHYQEFINPVAGEFTFGCRGFLWKNYGWYAELGIAKSLLQGGLCVRLGNNLPQ